MKGSIAKTTAHFLRVKRLVARFAARHALQEFGLASVSSPCPDPVLGLLSRVEMMKLQQFHTAALIALIARKVLRPPPSNALKIRNPLVRSVSHRANSDSDHGVPTSQPARSGSSRKHRAYSTGQDQARPRCPGKATAYPPPRSVPVRRESGGSPLVQSPRQRLCGWQPLRDARPAEQPQATEPRICFIGLSPVPCARGATDYRLPRKSRIRLAAARTTCRADAAVLRRAVPGPPRRW